ncbi:Phospholipid N-methyltransferase [Variovorax sp. YR750]|uniref:class I SAM-dependent methyltransferase n=1 Tax=Variovorax sp. YR750 TaxID=1884384 RepID=UPI0008C8E63D|nr:rRNA adenine N-6-methyltransferase family protein [Variovorax sp. YR750]SEM46252.1 Phospholipid N-methyltransferase [Variovorax sp. YR750]
MRSDMAVFLRSWLASPLKVGAIAPSGKALARMMTRGIGPATGHVVELGPGTGVFTRSLLSRGVREQDLTLIEFDEEFAHRLRRRFPRARVICTSAANVGGVDFRRGASVGAVVSGLPLLSMPVSTVSSILRGSFEHLHRDGKFFQFTYACRSPVGEQTLDALRLQANLVGSTWANLPPASVYGIRRLEEDR